MCRRSPSPTQIAFAHLKDSQGFRVCSGGRNPWMDSRGLAVHFHSRGLVSGSCGESSRRRGLVGHGAWRQFAGGRLGKRGPVDVCCRGRRLVIAGGTEPGAATHAAQERGVAGAEKLAWAEAFKLLKHPYVLVLWLVTFVDAFVHNCYFNWAFGFFTTQPCPRRRGHSGAMVHAGIEHWPGRRTPHHVYARRHTKAARAIAPR